MMNQCKFKLIIALCVWFIVFFHSHQVNQYHKESSPFKSHLEKSISSDPLANVCFMLISLVFYLVHIYS